MVVCEQVCIGTDTFSPASGSTRQNAWGSRLTRTDIHMYSYLTSALTTLVQPDGTDPDGCARVLRVPPERASSPPNPHWDIAASRLLRMSTVGPQASRLLRMKSSACL